MPESEKYYLQALDIRARLAKSNPQQFEPDLARTAMNLGNYYSDINNMPEAEKYYLQSLDIYSRLSKSNPHRFEPDLANVLNNFGTLYQATKQLDKAQISYSRALALRQKALLNGQTYFLKEYNRVFRNLRGVRDSFAVQNNYAKVVKIQSEQAKSKEILRRVLEKGDSTAASEYGWLAWYHLFVQQYPAAKLSAQHGLVLDASQTLIQTNLAHALLFQNKDAKAKKVYNALKIQKNTDGKSYRDILKEDFDTLEKEGLDKKQLDKARRWIKD